jgi:uncharacterized protein Smg (DUF494 family)
MAEQFENKKPNELMFSLVNPSKSFRIFSEEEKKVLTEEAHKTIITLLSLGIIRSAHVDMIMEKAESIGFKKITNDMVRQFVAYYMFDVPTPDEVSVRYSLCGNENIN